MGKNLLTLLVIIVLFASCQNQVPKPNTESKPNELLNTTSLNDLLKRYQESPQVYNVSSSKPTSVKGKKGTVIQINPGDLETVDGSAINGSIQVELKELTTTKEMLANNIQTVNDGKLLVSGGAYYINFKNGSQQLRLKPGKSLGVVFPKITDDKMSLFYGEKDSLGQINWQATSVNFEDIRAKPTATLEKVATTKSDIDQILDYIEKSDTGITPEEKQKRQRDYKIEKKVYDSLRLDRFGWINCDRFPEIEEKTDLFASISPTDSFTTANVFLVFKDINSLIQEYYYKGSSKDSYVKFENIPVGYKARLIAYTIKEGEVYSFTSDVTIKKSEKIDLPLKLTSEKEFKGLIEN